MVNGITFSIFTFEKGHVHMLTTYVLTIEEPWKNLTLGFKVQQYLAFMVIAKGGAYLRNQKCQPR